MSTYPISSALLNTCRRPAICVSSKMPLRDATRTMVSSHVGCVAVVDDDALVGILTERDLMEKITDRDAKIDDLQVTDVMTSQVHTIPWDASHTDAASRMLEHHCRHLPIVADDGHLLGMLSIRHVYRAQLKRLRGQMDSLESYVAADGPGG